MRTRIANKPSVAFVRASRVPLLGVGADVLGLWNAATMRNAKGYDVTLLLFGVFAAVSIRKRVRDRLDGIPMTAIRDGLAWFSVAAALSRLSIGLSNATLTLSAKGVYAEEQAPQSRYVGRAARIARAALS
ncbi:YiaA/YiaB family inner membrane protein [Xanthomonas fragariae]|nr:YiaA/YiaB family inner membrane protein [Xanthomonas fragariae]SMQ95692.1 membrane protein [Xanthomonas fragariae]